MAIIGIVAIAKNLAIGRNGKLPWHYSADLKFFKQTTSGHAVVMGSNTWRSIGRPLPNRLNVVLSHSGEIDAPPEVMKLETTDEVVELSKLLVKDVFIIGGAKTYAEFADVIDKWIVTRVPLEIDDADTFISSGFLDGFEVEKTKDLGDGLTVEFLHRKQN
jgi:dihydrofolate reductase